MRTLNTIPSKWLFPSKCTISKPEYNISFPSPQLFLGHRKVQIEPISTQFKVYVDTELDQQKFTEWLRKNLCESENYFTIDITVIGRDSEYLFRKIPDFEFNTAGQFFTFSVEIFTAWELADGAIDTTVPIITMLGYSPIEIIKNEVYVDAGATAIDNINGDITTDIVTVNNVDITTLGDHAVTYNVVDSSNNEAIEVIRNVSVVTEISIPQIQFVRFWQNGSEDTTGNYIVELRGLDTNDAIIPAIGYDLSGDLLTRTEEPNLTDGIVTLENALYIGSDLSAAELDFGSVVSVYKVQIIRYFDGRITNDTKIEISANGTDWTTIQDSAVTGTYAETEIGATFSTST